MKRSRYAVVVNEVHQKTFFVDAVNEEDAIDQAKECLIDSKLNTLTIYSHVMDSHTWKVRAIKDEIYEIEY